MIDILHKWFRLPHTLHVGVDDGPKNAALTVVFIHGLGSSNNMWKQTVHQKEWPDVRVLAIDLLGFGESPKPIWQTYSLDVHARALRMTLRRRRVKGPIILVGHSLGSLVAVHYTTLYPWNIRSLILCSPPFYRPIQAKNSIVPIPQIDDLYRQFYKYARSQQELSRKIALIIRQARLLDPNFTVTDETLPAIASSLEMSIENQTAIRDTRRLTMPISIIYGRLDPFILRRNLLVIQKDRPNITITSVLAGHDIIGSKVYVKQVKDTLLNTLKKQLAQIGIARTARREYNFACMLEYLETLVSFHPVTHDQKSVLRLLEYVGAHLKKRGFKTQILTYDGIVNLYASPTGKKHSRILLQSHIDVVPGGQPFRIENERCYGRGTHDMLFAAAAYMKLADELYEQDITCDIAFMLSGDEETGGSHGVEAMLNDGYTADVCILPDAGDEWGALSISAKGLYRPTVLIRGRAHHGAHPWDGDGASIKIARFIVEAEKLFDMSDRLNSTMTVSVIRSGETANQAPSEGEVMLDIRYKDQADFARILTGLEPLLKKYDGEIVDLLAGNDYHLDPDVPLIKTFTELYEKHANEPIRMTHAHGSSDARFFSAHGISVILLQPTGGNRHGDDEWISIPHFQKFYELLKEYILTTGRE